MINKIKSISLILGVLIMSVAVGYVVFGTGVPENTVQPPKSPAGICISGNPGCDAPINVSTNAQAKKGALVLGTDLSPASTTLIIQNGLVGIGTMNPSKKLQVVGDAEIGGNMITTGGLGVAGGFTAGGTGAASTLVVDAVNGRVGIGTTNPSGQFEIYKVGGAVEEFIRLNNPTIGGGSKIAFYRGSANEVGRIANIFSSGNWQMRLGSYQALETMTLSQSGNVGIGTTNPSEALEVKGKIKSGAATMNINGVVTSNIAITPEVYHIEATKAKEGTTVPLDMTIVERLCGDRDGCKITLGMRNYDANQPHLTASRGPYSFYYVGTNGWWRIENDTYGQDNNSAVQHILAGWSCYFTDAEYANFGWTDSAKGLGLLNWTGYSNSGSMVCTLTIEGNSGLGETTGDLVYGSHTSAECNAAGGTVVDDEQGYKMCRFNASSCPGNWRQYKQWSETVGREASTEMGDWGGCSTKGTCGTENRVYECTCSASGDCTYYNCYDYQLGGACKAVCNTAGHSWSNKNVESCGAECYASGENGGVFWTSGSSNITKIGCY